MATVEYRNHSYYFRQYCGTDCNGKRINKHMTWRPEEGMTERQIDKKVAQLKLQFEMDCKAGNVLDDGITFEKYVRETYLPRMKVSLKPTTYTRYNSLLNRILPSLGHLRMRDIRPRIIETFISNLFESPREDIKYLPNREATKASKFETRGEVAQKANISTTTVDSIRSGKKISRESATRFAAYVGKPVYKLFSTDDEFLSPRSVLHHYRLLSAILEEAFHDQVIQSNPCKTVRPPKVEQSEAKFLDEDQIEMLLEALDEKGEHPFDIMIKMLLYTGMRRGEICALEWDDIDLEHYLIDINKSLLYLPEMGVFESSTKNVSSKRVIKVSAQLIEMLKEYKLWQGREAIKLGDKWQCSNRVFASWNGSDINPGSLTKYLSRFVSNNGLPYISVHGLRHTNASIMIANHIPVTTAANRLGHSTPSTTTRIYAHPIQSADANAAEVLEITLSRKK